MFISTRGLAPFKESENVTPRKRNASRETLGAGVRRVRKTFSRVRVGEPRLFGLGRSPLRRAVGTTTGRALLMFHVEHLDKNASNPLTMDFGAGAPVVSQRLFSPKVQKKCLTICSKRCSLRGGINSGFWRARADYTVVVRRCQVLFTQFDQIF